MMKEKQWSGLRNFCAATSGNRGPSRRTCVPCGDLPSGRRAGRLPRNCCPPGRGAVRPGIPAGVGERHAGGDPGLGRDRLALLIETICATGHPGQRGAVYHGGGCRDRRGTDRHEGLGWTILLPQKLCRRLLKIRQNAKRSSPVRSFSPETESACPGNVSGRDEKAVRPCGRGGEQGVPHNY